MNTYDQQWFLHQNTPEEEICIQEISQALNLSPLLAKLLVKRKILSSHEAEKFLFGTLSHLPNPFLLTDMDRAIARILKALQEKERILLFGDYDVDGITGTAQLKSFLKEMGQTPESFLPHRLHDGYGLTESTVKKIISLKPKLLITIDNGTRSREAILHMKEQGIDTIVIDHHETPSEKEKMPVSALVNPKGINHHFQEKNIASAGLVFLLLMALRSKMREAGTSHLPNLKRYLDLACLGTIADVVPLTGTNRLLVKYGLEELAVSKREGIIALKEVAAITPPLGVTSVAFRIAPRINAAGRMDDPKQALDLLLSETPEEAQRLAATLEDFNRQRQKVEEVAVLEAIEQVEQNQLDRKGIVVASARWHLGVVGIVAARLTEKFHRPAIVLSLSTDGKEAKGSARTVSGVSVYEALKQIENEMLRFGGHDAAAGMSVLASNLENFSKKFDASVKNIWNEAPSPKLFIDAPLELKDINLELMKSLSLLEPHGAGNPEPTFITTETRAEGCRVVGKNHLKLSVRKGDHRLDAIGFQWAPYLETALKNDLHNLAYYPQINVWNGLESIQLKLKSILPV